MFKDTQCLDKFATILVGCSVTGAALTVGAPPPGVGETLAASGGLFATLRGQRRATADAILKDFQKTLTEEWQAWGELSSHADEGLRASAVASFEQVIPHCAPLPSEIVGMNLNAEAVAQRILKKAEIHLAAVYGDKNPANAESHVPRQFLLKLTRRAYAHLLAQPDYITQIAPDLWRGVLEQLDRIEQTGLETKADTETILREQKRAAQERAVLLAHISNLEQKLDAMPQAAQARAAGVSDRALFRLVRPIAEDVADVETALDELARAVEIAAKVQSEGKMLSNHGDFVDEVLRRVAELSADSAYGQAADEIEQALAREEAESQARKLRLLDRQIDLGILDRDPDATATRLVRKADIEAGGKADLEALRAIAIEWGDRGRDKGLNFDLEVAIALAHLNMTRATTADERGAIGNDLGIALQTLGEREPGTDRLEQAVAAYTDALKEHIRDRVPLDWAITQNNLANALRNLGERETGTDRLEQAVSAYTEALKERTRDRVPLGWAATQDNLGGVLQTLGARETGTDRLEQAVTAFANALKERTRDRVPVDWAMTQNNIGIALQTLGARETGTDRLEQAVTAHTETLKEVTRDRLPLDWAKAQNNLGNALAILGAREAGTDRLEQAVSAYTEALREHIRNRVPLDWAMTQNNLGNALRNLGERETGTDRLEQAVTAYTDALREYARDRVPLAWAATTCLRAHAEALIAERTGDRARALAARDPAVTAQAVLAEGGHAVWAEEAKNVVAKIDRIIAALFQN